jgi:hypothetical protein
MSAPHSGQVLDLVARNPELSEGCGGICIFNGDDFVGTTTGFSGGGNKDVPQREQNIDSLSMLGVPHFGQFIDFSGFLGRRAPHLLQKSD